MPYSTFCTCSRNCSTAALSSRPILVSSTSLALAHSVLASRLSSWARKSSRRPTAPPCHDQLLRLRDVRREAIELLAHVGLGSRSGSPPDAAGRDRSGPIARAAPRPVRRAAPGSPRARRPGAILGALRERGDLAKPRRQNPRRARRPRAGASRQAQRALRQSRQSPPPRRRAARPRSPRHRRLPSRP